MNQNNSSELVKSLSFQNHPLHMFLLHGNPAFFTKEVGEILDISSPTQSLRQSKTLETGVDYDTISTVSLGEINKLFIPVGNHVSVLYLSGFFLFVLRSNKPIAVPYIRWAIREAIPMTMMQNQPPEVTKE